MPLSDSGPWGGGGEDAVPGYTVGAAARPRAACTSAGVSTVPSRNTATLSVEVRVAAAVVDVVVGAVVVVVVVAAVFLLPPHAPATRASDTSKAGNMTIRRMSRTYPPKSARRATFVSSENLVPS